MVVGYEPVCSWAGINLVLIVADGLDDAAHPRRPRRRRPACARAPRRPVPTSRYSYVRLTFGVVLDCRFQINRRCC